MNLTDNYGIPYPDPTDYAAQALYMQRLAEAAEAQILAERALVTDFTRQPAGIWSNRNNVTATSGGGVSSMSIDNPIWTNVPGWDNVGFSGGGTGFPEAGIYHVGWDCVLMLELGALTPNSIRDITFIVRQQTGSGVDLVLQDLSRHVLSSAGQPGERFGSDGLVVVPENVRNLINFRIEFSHTNAASQVRINAGNLIGFWRRIGSTAQIEVL